MTSNEQNRTIYVGGLSPKIKASTLREKFKEYGQIYSVELHNKIKKGIMSFYAFITFKLHVDGTF